MYLKTYELYVIVQPGSGDSSIQIVTLQSFHLSFGSMPGKWEGGCHSCYRME